MEEFIIKNNTDRLRLIDAITVLDISRPLKFTWKLFKHKRTLDANALLHVWLGQLAEHPQFIQHSEGLEKKERIEGIKDALKKRFLGYETVTHNDPRTWKPITVERLRRTRDLDSGEFCFFLERIQAWGLENLGVILTSSKDDEFSKWQDEQNR